MEHFNRVLAAVDMGADGTEVTAGSRKALKRAVWIARRVGASVTMLHSDGLDEYWDSESDQFVRGMARSDSRTLVEAALGEYSFADVETDIVIRSGSAWRAIVEEVVQRDIDIVVAAKRTHVHSDERRLGTVAHKLLRKCPCPVWLEDPRKFRDPSVILAATDLSAVGDRVVALAASVAHALGAELHVVHAFSISMEAQLEGEEGRRRYEREKRDGASAHIEQVLSATPIAGEAEVHIGCTSPTQAVLECVARLRPGLVVMGTVSRGGISGLLLGNTAERLIDRIDCALLTIKPDDFVCPVTVGESS